MDINNLLQGHTNKDILIIGDFVLDRYIEVEKFNTDIDKDPFGMEYVWKNQINSIGGAGIVARQCKEINHRVSCIGIAGRDIVGKELILFFQDQHIDFIDINHDGNLLSPFRERISRIHDLKVLKLIRNGYFGNEIPKCQIQLNRISTHMESLSNPPAVLFLCDFLHGFFTDNVFSLFGELNDLQDTICVLKTRLWKDIYRKLPVDLLCIDACKDWLKDPKPINSVQQNLLRIAEKINKPVFIICKIDARGEKEESQLLLCSFDFSEIKGKTILK
jgi:hypothetical protein